ncbi:MAG: OmpA family protein [Deltaproteobacteria bacterium]|nr:OmpA family protein [Deltaproteobacteria bacterium]
MSNRVAVAVLGAFSLTAALDTARAENPKVDVQVFRPSAHAGDLLSTMLTDIGEHTQYGVQLLVNFGKNALVFVDKTGELDLRHEVIQDQLTADVMGSIALWDRLSVGLAIPLFLVNSGQADGFIPLDPEPDGFALGDIRLSPKVGILVREDDADGLGVAASVDVGLPTGDANAFVSDGFTVAPTFMVDYKAGALVVAANLGYRIRTEETVLYDFADVGSEFFWRLGAKFAVVPDQLEVLGEVYGASADWGAANNTHLEGMLAGRLKLPGTGLGFTVGGGSGFTKGYGNTKFRIFAGVSWSPEVVLDADGDGVLDAVDKCPTEPEDVDRYQDDDGCPDPDNDSDGIADVNDRCPMDAEDKDGHQDEDGCPDLDNDGDGLNDSDDRCPDAAEDKDQFEDEDGCPDEDNDNDRIKDGDDRCPLEPEVYNGKEDEDGCPDETLAKVEKGKIVIAQKIYFDTGKATIKPESFPVLEAVAGILKANPEIKRVAIEGHTDDVGADARNMKLSDDRSKSVMTWLTTTGGIAADRLTAQGFGETRPAVVGKTKDAREANRRVEFIIGD